jgi:dCMP deaminase
MAKSNKKKPPRETVDADDYFMSLAFWTATRSRDPHRQEGAVIVGHDRILAAEPNGIPELIRNDDFSWERVERLDYVERAIPNALWSAASQLHGGDTEPTIYVTSFPSKRCMRAIVRAKLDKVIWFPLHEKMGINAEMSEKESDAVKKLASLSKVTLDEYKGNLNWMRDQMSKFEAVGIFK